MQTWNGYHETQTRNSDGRGAEPQHSEFEGITVRAAARVLELQKAGVITEVERRFYLSELAAMDERAGPEGDAERLRVLACRHLAAVITRALEAAQFALAA